MLVYPLLNPLSFVAFRRVGLRGGPSRTGAKAYPARSTRCRLLRAFDAGHEQATVRRMDRHVTDEQRSRRPIFNVTFRAAASWLFFRVVGSTRMTRIWALRSRLEKQPTNLRRSSRDL